MNNIYIEGIQGTGKSTLLNMLNTAIKDYSAYHDGDLSPVSIAWCAFMSPDDYGKVCLKYPPLMDEIKKQTHQSGDDYVTAYTKIITDEPCFHRYMERFEIKDGKCDYQRFKQIVIGRFQSFEGDGNLFEGAFFQNVIETLMLFYQLSDEAIMAFYSALFEAINPKTFKLIYIQSQDIQQLIEYIKAMRTDLSGQEVWFNLLLAYFENSPYGKSSDLKGLEGLIRHLEHRQALELKIIENVIGYHAKVIQSKAFYFPKLIKWSQTEGSEDIEG